MIRIFESTATDFTSNGLGAITNIVTRSESDNIINNMHIAEFDMIYDKWGKWKHVVKDNIIHADGQPYRIIRTRKSLQGFTVYCRHVFWDLLTNEVRDVRPTNKNAMSAGQDLLNGATLAHPFTFFSDILDTNTQYYINRNLVDCIVGKDSLQSRWGGDLRLNGWEIGLVGQLGQDNGVSISYRKNMQRAEVEEATDGRITKLRPKGRDGLELPEVYLDSPYIGNYHTAFIGEVEFPGIGVDDETTEAEAIVQLRAAGIQYFTDSQCDIPKVNIKVDMVLLENTEEYENFKNLVKVNLGDTVTCKHLDLGIDHKARVIRIKKDLLTGRSAMIEIGDFKKTMNTTFTKISNTINDMSALIQANKTSLQAAIDNATALLTNSLGGYVVKRAGELLIMDTEDPATCVKVWRWNLNGLGYSSTGINGPYGIAMTMDGRINASFITVGELDAAIIKVGILKSANNASWINMATGAFNFGSGKLIWDGTSLSFSDGITIVDKNGVRVGTDLSAIFTRQAYEGFSVYDGDTLIATFGEPGAVVPNLQAQSVTSLDLINTINASVTLNVGTGQTYGSVAQAINAAFGANKRILRNNSLIKINIYGTVNENVVIEGFQGNGIIDIEVTTGSILKGYVIARHNTVTVKLHGYSAGAYGVVDAPAGIPIYNDGSAYLDIYYLNIKGAGVDNCVLGEHGGVTKVEACDISGGANCLVSSLGHDMRSINNRGNGSYIGCYGIGAGVIYITGSYPVGGTIGYGTSSGFIHTDAVGAATASTYNTPPVTSQQFIQIFNPTNMYTVNHDTSLVDSFYGATAAQGKWYTMNYWKDGVVKFGADVANFFAGGSGTVVEIRVRRASTTHGTSAAVVPKAYGWTPGAAFNAITRGQWSNWVTLPASLFTGSGALLKFYNSALDSGYAVFDDAEVRVTTTKSI